MLRDAGGSEVVLSEFKGSLEMTRQSLLHLGVPPTEVQRYTETARQELYAYWFSKDNEYRVLSKLRDAEQQFDLQ
jgi:CPA2 family monovalent cation:H+ antiporter-2